MDSKSHIVFFLLLGGCVQPFRFETLETERILVVEASLTNETRAHYVNISFTFPLDQTKGMPESGAMVRIEDDQGNTVTLNEEEPGEYVTSSDFAGVPGRSYALHIETSDGKAYMSSWESLLPSMTIDSLYGRYMALPSENDASTPYGVQIFIDGHTDFSDPVNVRYEYIESYEIKVPLPSRYDWSGTGEDFEVTLREREVETCYRLNQSSDLLIETTDGLSENRIREFPVRFIPELGPQLVYQYLIQVRQYTISREIGDLYRNLRENNEIAGSFFDKQRGTVFGNIAGVENADLPVLGFFEVAGVSEIKRILTPDDFKDAGLNVFPTVCGRDAITNSVPVPRETKLVEIMEEDSTYTVLMDSVDWSFLDNFLHNPMENGPNMNILDTTATAATLAFKVCSDCRFYGLIERPQLWD